MLSEDKGVKKNIIRIGQGNKEEITDIIAREIELSIYVNQKKIIRLYCSPGNYKFLGAGFLFSTGILASKEDILLIETNHNSVNIITKNSILSAEYINYLSSEINSKHQVKKLSIKNTDMLDSLVLKHSIVFTLMAEMQNKAVFFKESGSVHSCGLANRNGIILLFAEDISRYNTIDRILGESLLKDINTSDKIILTSCRITSGIIKKIIQTGISIVISRSAVTDCAINMAHRNNITLIGFARNERMNIYSHPERIIL